MSHVENKSASVLSVNAYCFAYPEKITPFIHQAVQEHDVVLLQEITSTGRNCNNVYIADKANHYKGLFENMKGISNLHCITSSFRVNGKIRNNTGIGIISKHPFTASSLDFYWKRGEDVVDTCPDKANHALLSRALLSVKVDIPNFGKLAIGNTHFNWFGDSRSGRITLRNIAAATKLLEHAKELDLDVLCGDWNLPYESKWWDKLFGSENCALMRCEGTINSKLHKHGKNGKNSIPVTVDNAFLPTLKAKRNLSITDGMVLTESNVSDHHPFTFNVVRSF